MNEWALYILLFWIAVFAVALPFIIEDGRESARIQEEYWNRFNERCRYMDAMFSKEAGYSPGLISKEAGE